MRWLTLSVVVCLGGALVSCASNEPLDPVNDQADAAVQPQADSGAPDAVSTIDSAAEASSEASALECPPESVSNIPNPECDLIKQDCPTGMTCHPGVFGQKAVATCKRVGNGFGTPGDRCETAADCSAGLICAAKYCAPFCCPEYQYEICGPGGRCSMTLGNNVFEVNFCTYAKECELFGDDCSEDEACQPVGNDGSAACTVASSGSFVGEGQPCTVMNDCGDSQICVTYSTGERLCRYLCKTDGSSTTPGKGGCPVAQSCRTQPDFPSWLGLCRPFGG